MDLGVFWRNTLYFILQWKEKNWHNVRIARSLSIGITSHDWKYRNQAERKKDMILFLKAYLQAVTYFWKMTCFKWINIATWDQGLSVTLSSVTRQSSFILDSALHSVFPAVRNTLNCTFITNQVLEHSDIQPPLGSLQVPGKECHPLQCQRLWGGAPRVPPQGCVREK